MNFSSATTPELLLKTFDHYCEYKRTPNGVILSPVQLNKWLVLFCDEINLPNMDTYGKRTHKTCELTKGCSYQYDMITKYILFDLGLILAPAYFPFIVL